MANIIIQLPQYAKGQKLWWLRRPWQTLVIFDRAGVFDLVISIPCKNPVFPVSRRFNLCYAGNMMTKCTTALIIAPPGRLRESLRVLVRAISWITQIEQADDGPTGLRLIADHSPAVVLLDTLLPDDQIWETLQQIKLKWTTVRCVVLAHTHTQEQQAQLAGAAGVLPDGFSSEVFFDLMDAQQCREDTAS